MFHVGAIITDFRISSISMRDKLYLEKERLCDFLHLIPLDAPLCEIVTLCTCNRIEIYYVCQDHEAAINWLTNFLANYHKIPISHLREIIAIYKCEEAVRHLFRVSSGIESMVFGEHEILGQVRNAYFFCMQNKSTHSYLNRLFQQAIATGKQVRSHTAVGQGAFSVVTVALERMGEIAGDFGEKKIMVVGVGVMGFRALKQIAHSGFQRVGLSNRTDERALKLSSHFNAEHVPFCDIAYRLNDYDIILLATASERYILNTSDVLAHRNLQENPLMIVDLGAPRNADPELKKLKNVTLICIDDLRLTSENIIKKRKNELEQINNIIEEQVNEYKRWYLYKSGCLCVQS